MAADRSVSIFQHKALVAFNLAYLLAAIVGCAVTGNLEFVFYLATLAVLIAVVLVVHRRVGFSAGVLWGLSLWAAAHMAGGLMPIPERWPHAGDSAVLYSLWIFPDLLKYDHLVHAYGFGTTTFACWQGLQTSFTAAEIPLAPTAGPLFLVASAACGLGAANEIVEFLATVLVPETNVGGYRNTALDLLANAIGAAVAAVLIASRYQRR